MRIVITTAMFFILCQNAVIAQAKKFEEGVVIVKVAPSELFRHTNEMATSNLRTSALLPESYGYQR